MLVWNHGRFRVCQIYAWCDPLVAECRSDRTWAARGLTPVLSQMDCQVSLWWLQLLASELEVFATGCVQYMPEGTNCLEVSSHASGAHCVLCAKRVCVKFAIDLADQGTGFQPSMATTTSILGGIVAQNCLKWVGWREWVNAVWSKMWQIAFEIWSIAAVHWYEHNG